MGETSETSAPLYNIKRGEPRNGQRVRISAAASRILPAFRLKNFTDLLWQLLESARKAIQTAFGSWVGRWRAREHCLLAMLETLGDASWLSGALGNAAEAAFETWIAQSPTREH